MWTSYIGQEDLHRIMFCKITNYLNTFIVTQVIASKFHLHIFIIVMPCTVLWIIDLVEKNLQKCRFCIEIRDHHTFPRLHKVYKLGKDELYGLSVVALTNIMNIMKLNKYKE